MSTELDKILRDCTCLRDAISRDVGNEAADLRDRVRAEMVAYKASIPPTTNLIGTMDGRRMLATMTNLARLANALDTIAGSEAPLVTALDRLRDTR